MLAEKNDHPGESGVGTDFEAYSSLGIATLAVDTAFNIIFINEKASNSTGYAKADVLQKKLFDIAAAGELRRTLSRAFRGDAVERELAARGQVVTRNGRIRSVRWQCRTLYYGLSPSGAIVSWTDVTSADMAREAVRIAAQGLTLEDTAVKLMDLLSDPLNLKLVRLSLSAGGSGQITITRAYPHGGLRKKPRHALCDRELSSPRHMEIRCFPLEVAGRNIGMLEVTAYAGSALSGEDLECIRTVVDALSAGLARMLPSAPGDVELTMIRDDPSTAAIVDPHTRTIIEASHGFYALAGSRDVIGKPFQEVLPDREILESIRSAASSGMPCWGVAESSGRCFCCMPLKDAFGRVSSVIVSVMEGRHFGPEPGQTSVTVARQIESLLSVIPHGVAVCDRDGTIVTANDAAGKILELERGDIEGRSIAEVVKAFKPRRMDGSVMSRRHLAAYRAMRGGAPVLNVMFSITVNGSRRTISSSARPSFDEAGAVTGCMVTIRDVTVLDAIFQLGRLAVNTRDIDDFVEESLDTIMNAAQLRLLWPYLWDGGELTLKVQKGDPTNVPLPVLRDTPDPASPTVQSKAFLRGKPVLIKDYRRCSSVRLFDPLARNRAIRSVASLPLLVEGGTIGVLVAATGDERTIGKAQLSELAAMCDRLATGLEIALCRRGPTAYYSGA